MPSKNSIKQFDVRSMYHVYNRGNDKRLIFHDERDYAVFLSYLKYALLSNESRQAKEQVDRSLISNAQQFNLRRLGLAGRVEIVSYCLMPNHFHLQLFQEDESAISTLMRSVATGYVTYYNKRYKKSGRLFQGVYKASKVTNDSYWKHISRYIHLNPLDIGADYRVYAYSSYKYYTGDAEAEWVNPTLGMSGMTVSEYKKFVEEWVGERDQLKDIKLSLANR